MEAAQYANPKHFNAYTGSVGAQPPRRASPLPSSTQKPTAAVPSPVEDAHTNSTAGGQQAELNQTLSKYTRGGDRRQVLRTLADAAALPRMHPLKSVWVEDIAAAEREAAGERAVLNGVKFLQVKSGGSGGKVDDKAPVDSYFLQTLREICGHMCDMDGVDADPMALYGGLLLRLSRSVSERDALETVTPWTCGKGELVALPLKRRHHDEGCRCADPIELELFVEAGNVHAKVTMRHELGVHVRTNLESHGMARELSPWTALVTATQGASTTKSLTKVQYECLGSPKSTNPKPWIYVDADVVERINFGTGSSVRMLHVNLPGDKNSGYVKKL